jgi:hypothetical protein
MHDNTLMFGEKHIRPGSLRGRNEDRSVYTSGNTNNARRWAGYQNNTFPGQSQHLYAADARRTNGFNAATNSWFGGPHSGICLFVFCDGGVRRSPAPSTLTR